MKNKVLLLFIVTLFTSSFVHADDGYERPLRKLIWNFNLGLNFGGSMPVPLPREVRKIESYNPKINPHVGISTLYRFTEKWGIGTELSLNVKGMRVKDRVKYMHAKVQVSEKGAQERREVEGYFVGDNTTNVKFEQVCINIFANYEISKTWELQGGMYIANNLKGKFYGNVSNGYLREGTPNGNKIDISKEDPATFDFEDDLRDFDLGLVLGAKFNANNRVGVFANLNWGFTDIFYSSSNPIDFKMQNVYLLAGVSYRIK